MREPVSRGFLSVCVTELTLECVCLWLQLSVSVCVQRQAGSMCNCVWVGGCAMYARVCGYSGRGPDILLRPGSSQRPLVLSPAMKGLCSFLRGTQGFLPLPEPRASPAYSWLSDSKPVPGVGCAPGRSYSARAGRGRCELMPAGFQVLLLRPFQTLWLGRPWTSAHPSAYSPP